MEEKWEYKKLKTLEQIQWENPGYTQYAGSIQFSGCSIAQYMFKNFGLPIYVRIGYGGKYYDKEDYYYIPDWFLPDMDKDIDNLFENLLEGI